MMASGQMTKQMAMAFTNMLTELSTKVSGKMISSTVKEWKRGQMDQCMMEITLMEKSMALVLTNGMMDHNI